MYLDVHLMFITHLLYDLDQGIKPSIDTLIIPQVKGDRTS